MLNFESVSNATKYSEWTTGENLPAVFTTLRREIEGAALVPQEDTERMMHAMDTACHNIFSTVYLGNYSCLEALYTGEQDIESWNGTHFWLPLFTSVITVAPHTMSLFPDFDPAAIELVDVNQTVEKHYRIIPDDNSDGWKILENNFGEMFEMIDKAIGERKSILVHCSQGQSRSAIVVIAYLMNRCGVTYEQALNYVRSKRFLVDPKPELAAELKEYHS